MGEQAGKLCNSVKKIFGWGGKDFCWHWLVAWNGAPAAKANQSIRRLRGAVL
jgi:hypothetical protein